MELFWLQNSNLVNFAIFPRNVYDSVIIAFDEFFSMIFLPFDFDDSVFFDFDVIFQSSDKFSLSV